MPLYEITAPDGKTYEIQGPPGATQEQVAQAVLARNPMAGMTTAELEKAPSAPFSFGDVSRALGMGVTGGVKSIADVFGAGSGVSNYLGQINQELQKGLTPARQEEMTRRQELVNRAQEKGLGSEIYANLAGIAEAPIQSTLQAVGSSVPSILAGLAVLPEAAPAGIVLGVEVASRALMGAVQGVGETKGDIHDQIKQAYLDKNYSDEEAEKKAVEAQAYTVKTAPLLIGGAAFGALDAATGIQSSASRALRSAIHPETKALVGAGLESALKGLAEKPLEAPTALKSFLHSAAEEAIPEGLQGAFGQYAQNVAMKNEGFETPTMQGVIGSGARDLLAGALAGGVFSPMAHAQAIQDVEADKTLRKIKALKDFEAERQAAINQYNKNIQQTKANLNVQNILALPAPAEKAEEKAPEVDRLNNPLGNLTKDELNPEVVKYIDQYRKENNLPKLKEYSIEDVKDAMTNINPAGEQGALDSFIVAKTGYTGEQKYTPDDVINAAVKNNVATGTNGFNDFLTRTTGTADLNAMSQPQLHSAFKALMDLNRTPDDKELILPQGTNAKRFTEKQYNSALKFVNENLTESKPLNDVITDIKDASNLENDRDAQSLLKEAVKNGDLTQTSKDVFNVVKDGEVVSTHDSENEAKAAVGRKKGLNIEQDTVQLVGPKEAEVAPETVRTPLPSGYEIQKETLKAGEEPAGHAIIPEGQQQPLTTVPTLEGIQEKINQMQGARQSEAARLLADVQKHTDTLNKNKNELTRMEALGQSGTEAYKKLSAQQARAEDILARRIKRTYDQIERLKAPLKTKPIGKKTTTREVHTVIKDGKKIGSFPSNDAALKSIVTQLSDKELSDLASDKRKGPIKSHAQEELDLREAKAQGKQASPGLKERLGLLTPEATAKIEEIKAKLLPLLAKFGLRDVGLKIVKSLENNAEGSYLDKLITIAYTADNPIQTMRHEALHALKNLGFFTDAQWESLKKQAREVWVDKYLKGVNAELDGKVMSRYDAYAVLHERKHGNLDNFEEEMLEEAIADAFGDFEVTKPPPGMLAALFKRLQNFFKALKQAFTGAGFESPEDIFNKIERGELEGQIKSTGEEKLALKKYKPDPKIAKEIGDMIGLSPKELASTSLEYQTGKKGGNQFSTPFVGDLADTVNYLQEKRLESGLPVLDLNDPKDRFTLAKMMAAEAMSAIRANGSALEWYDQTINKTLGMAALKFQELNKDLNARTAFRIAMAITSQGLNPEDNLKFAMNVYSQFRKNNKFPEVGQGGDGKAMVNNFKLANKVLEEMTMDVFRKFLETPFTVKELENAGFNVGGELKDEMVLGSSIFGPKIGFGFYSNLSGNFEPVTMDMWFMRMVGRLTGTLKAFKQEKFDEQLRRFRNELNITGENGVFASDFKPEIVKQAKTDLNTAIELARAVKSAHERSFIKARPMYEEKAFGKSELVLASESLLQSLNGSKDAPASGGERRLLRDVVQKMVDIVQQHYGQRIPPASLQALVWYPEQELYKSLGVKLRVTSQDYAGAAEKILKGEGYGESELRSAAKSGSRTAQQLAGQSIGQANKGIGAKPQPSNAFQGAEREEFLEGRINKEFFKKEAEKPSKKRVVFEVAPDPNNKLLVAKWRELSNEERLSISEKVAKKILNRALEYFDTTGRITTQIGSYLDDTNPSFALFLDKGNSVDIAKFLGFALSQNEMMVISPNPGAELDKTNAIVINVGKKNADEINDIYQELRSINVNGEQPISGQSYMNGQMVILNNSKVSNDQLAELIDSKLNQEYNISTAEFYTSFLEKKDYDYANQTNDPRGKGSIIRQGSRNLRAEASVLLEDELSANLESAPAKTEKLSLKTYYPTAEEAEKAAYKKSPPETHEFKLFFGASKAMEDGRPQVMYHGTDRDITQFRENAPIFVSPDAEFAEQFAERRVKFKDSAAKKIYPLWVRSETPFDYENPDHVNMVMNYLKANNLADQNLEAFKKFYPNTEPTLKIKLVSNAQEKVSNIEKSLARGDWRIIEDGTVQNALKALGFDSFHIKEQNIKQLAVFSANQIKSVTGNVGDFGANKDIRFSLSAADSLKIGLTDKRIDNLINTNVYTQSDAAKKTKAYIAYVSPKDFLNATISKNYRETIEAEKQPLDLVKLTKESQPIVLFVEESKGKKHELDVKGHEGRHRMMALRDAGFEQVPVVFQFSRGENREPIDDLYLHPQKFYENNYGASGFVAESLTPINYENINVIKEKFSQAETKYSLPSVRKDIEDRINETTTTREEKGFAQRITEALSPQGFSYFRQKALNRYNRLSEYDKLRAEKMGGAAFLADQSAEGAALLSDLGAGVTASALGFGDRNGGIPVYKNGFTTIDKSIKGLVAALSPLARYGDPKVYQRFQYWAGSIRGYRLDAEGREHNFTAADYAFAKELERQHPEFKQVMKDYTAFNNGVVKYLVDTGVISEEQGKEYTKYADYIPFYRQMDGEQTIGPNIFHAISGVKQPKKLKGGEAPLADFLETVVRNTQSAINAGMKNQAAQRAVKVALDLNNIERLNTVASGPDIIEVLEKGKKTYYRTPDNLFVDAIKSLNMPELPFMSLISAPSNLLRNFVTKDPGFMLANMMRDSLSAWVTSGQDSVPFVGTFKQFGKSLAGKSKEFDALIDAGVLGGYEFSQNVKASGRLLEKDLSRKNAPAKGLGRILSTAESVWDALEKGTTASDAATRALVYERVLRETGNEAEAIYRALEVMNFNRKGNSPVVRILTAAVPFLNARFQGLDVFWRTASGGLNNPDAKKMQAAFIKRGLLLMGLTAMYYASVQGDPDYEKQEEETKDNYWILPQAGVKIPIPFEVGVLFKVIPERILSYYMGNSTGQDLLDSAARNLSNTFAFNPIPQAVKPIVEDMTNFNFFTMRPIVGQGMEGLEAKYQIGPGTSITAKKLGEIFDHSPLKIDNMIRGYFGAVGTYATDLIDSVLDAGSESPKASKRLEQMAVFKRFMVDPEARGNITAYYALKDQVDTAVKTANYLKEAGSPEEFQDYMVKNQYVLANKDYINELDKSMKAFRDMRKRVNGMQATPDEKREMLIEIGHAENNLTENIKEVKKLIASQ